MSWFDDQVEYRKKHERELLTDSFENIARSITGRRQSGILKEGEDVNDAVAQLLKYFHVKEKQVPGSLTRLEDKLDYLLSSTGIQYREVVLEKGWHADAMGTMIGTLKGEEEGSSDAVITLVPGDLGGYQYIDPYTGRAVRVTPSEEKKIGTEALCFYKPLPMRSISLKDLLQYMVVCLTPWDLASFGIAAFIITLVGMLVPKLNHILMGEVIQYRSYSLLFAVMTFMVFATIGTLLFNAIKTLLLSRINIKLNANVRSATMMRILALPAPFFKQYSAGELSQYLEYMNSLCDTLVNSILSTGITGVFSLVYLTLIFAYAKSLVVPSILMTLLTLAVSLIASSLQMQINKESMTLSAKEKGLVFSLISGIQKIRLSGAENRAFVKWSDKYAQEVQLVFTAPGIVKFTNVITGAITLIGTGIMFFVAVQNKVYVADYYAFNAAYAYISTAFTALASVATTIATIKPSIDIVKPLMDAEPELTEGLETVTRLTGNIEISHVSFRYEQEGPKVIDDLSLNIPARQYVAIVGKSGCGKSTLMRLLLGFEKPTRGTIFYDRKDIQRLDMASVRRQIGTVMQDGMMFSGSIFENITISAPMAKLDDAWEAAEIAGIADEIRGMPMGMNTMIQEGAGGISGGQRQRLMIARAVAPKPKILMFDEATSALDNITQKKVAEALDGMKCTRIVIAHRLSTIKHCDRILVLDQGKIIEDGTYEELIAKNGYFADLVERQRLDVET